MVRVLNSITGFLVTVEIIVIRGHGDCHLKGQAETSRNGKTCTLLVKVIGKTNKQKCTEACSDQLLEVMEQQQEKRWEDGSYSLSCRESPAFWSLSQAVSSSAGRGTQLSKQAADQPCSKM